MELSQAKFNKLTEEEVLVLAEEFNLADGHAYRAWNAAETAIVESIADLFRRTDRRDHRRIESEYFRSFFALSKQTLRTDRFQCFLCFTASTALEVIANYLRMNKLSAALIEPCFDNLHDIFARHHIPLSVLSESLMTMEPEQVSGHLNATTSDAIVLVSPNNPTGLASNQANFACFIDFCRAKQKTLILDATFRFYLPEEEVYDQYQMLAESDIDYIIVEDTGKTWPTHEIKAPFFSVSAGLVAPIAEIYSDFLLHVSPIAVALLNALLRLSPEDGLQYIRRVIDLNRSVLYCDLRGTFLCPMEAGYMSVAWLEIKAPLRAVELKDQLARNGVYVLAGNQFFWSDPTRGERYIRVALSRDPTMFREASARLAELCRTIR
jgi:aspartate/methionine/tyrosine aminotransferase